MPETPDQTPQSVDPIEAFKQTYQNASDYSDQKIYQHLSDPTKFRQTLASHPDYGDQFSQMSDDQVKAWSQRKGLTRPDLVAPPSLDGEEGKKATIARSGINEAEPTSTAGAVSGFGGYFPGVKRAPLHHATTGEIAKQTLGVAADVLTPQTMMPGRDEETSPGGHVTRAADEFGQGHVARGIHEATEAAGGMAAPATLPMAGENPIGLLKMITGGVVGGAAGKYGSQGMGADDETQQASEDVGGVLGGLLGAKSTLAGIRRGLMPAYDQTSAAAEIHGAVNPKVRFKANSGTLTEYPDTEYQAEVSRQLPKIKQFADDNGIEVKGKKELSMASEGAANALKQHYAENVLGPHKNAIIPIKNVPGYAGEQIAPGAATLEQIDRRLGDVNAELNPRYRKAGGGGQEAQAAVRSEGELKGERDALNQILYGELSSRTGLTQDQLRDVRQGYAELHSVADTTRRELANEQRGENNLRNKKIGATSKEGLVKEGVARVAQRLQPSPSDSRVANVFKKMNVPGYAHPVPPNVGLNSPNAASLSSVAKPSPGPESALEFPPKTGGREVEGIPAALARILTPATPPGDALANVGPPKKVQAPSLYRGGTGVPAPLSSALSSLEPTMPTGEGLQTPPFSYPYRQGDELGEAASDTTAGEKRAERRFKSENPSALADIKPSNYQRAEAARSTPKPPPAKSNASPLSKIGDAVKSQREAEVAQLKKRLAELQAKNKKPKESK